MKKIISMVLALTFIFSTLAFAAPVPTPTQTTTTGIPAPTVTPKPTQAPPKEITVKVDGKDIKWPAVISKAKPKISTPKPYMQGEAVMVPLKPVAAVVGYKVSQKGKTVTVASGTAKTMITLGDAKAVVNGTEKALQTPAVLKSNAVYVPAELLSPMFDFTNKDWFADTKTLAVYSQFAVQDLWTRLYNSNRYEWDSPKYGVGYGEVIAPKGMGAMNSFGISINKQTTEPEEVRIGVTSPYFEVRQQLKEILKMAYPTSWETVYDLFMKTERDEIFELNYCYPNFAGTYNRYYDNRHLRVQKMINNGERVNIVVGLSGEKYPIRQIGNNAKEQSPVHEANIRIYRLFDY